jgi:hypothetical protein
MIGLLLADGLDGFVPMHQLRHVVCQEVKERFDGRQALISRARLIVAVMLKVIEEVDNQFTIKLIDAEFLGLHTEARAGKADQHLKAVAVAGDAVGGQATFGGQILLKESGEEVAEAHDFLSK